MKDNQSSFNLVNGIWVSLPALVHLLQVRAARPRQEGLCRGLRTKEEMNNVHACIIYSANPCHLSRFKDRLGDTSRLQTPWILYIALIMRD